MYRYVAIFVVLCLKKMQIIGKMKMNDQQLIWKIFVVFHPCHLSHIQCEGFSYIYLHEISEVIGVLDLFSFDAGNAFLCVPDRLPSGFLPEPGNDTGMFHHIIYFLEHFCLLRARRALTLSV